MAKKKKANTRKAKRKVQKQTKQKQKKQSQKVQSNKQSKTIPGARWGKTQAEKIASIPIETISKMGKQDRLKLEGYIKALRKGFVRRVASIHKQNLVSHAEIAFLSGTRQLSLPDRLEDFSRNQLIFEFARYSEFFKNKTSTVSGIKEVNKQQDSHIFGTDKRGNPKQTMNSQERMLYWIVYDEFLNQNPLATSKYSSESVQQILADVMFSKGNPTEYDVRSNFAELLNNVRTSLEADYMSQNIGSVPGVYSGRGDFKPR